MPEMWQKVAKFKGAEYFRKALYVIYHLLIKQRRTNPYQEDKENIAESILTVLIAVSVLIISQLTDGDIGS